MPVDSSGKYRGKHFDPNFKHPRQPGFSYTGYHPHQSSRYDDLNPAREPLRDRGQQYVQNGSERDHHAAYRGRPTSNNYSTPRGPRESYPQARGPSMPQVSPIGTIHPSGLPLIPDLPPPEKANGSNGDSPSMNSRPSSASQPLHPKPPSSGSLPFGTSLESLDKLRQFKAEVEASRRQHQATELEPGKLAQMAESFLRSQQHEPGEVSEDTSQVKPTLSPRSREQELKEKLRSRLKSPDGEGSGGVKRERESGEIVETIEQKRPRAEEPHQHPAQNHSPYDQKRADEEVLSRGYTDQRYFRDQAPQANPPRHAELASQLRERVEAVHILLPEQPRNDQPRQREENTYSQLSNPHHKEDYQIESSKRPFAEHGNGGRFTKREDTPSSVARKESSTYERRSLSE